jgi:protein O-GlcNAc transferase
MTPAKLQTTLQEALTHHRAGRLDRAAALYEQVRKQAPRHFDALHLAGTVAYQQGRHADAIRLLNQAIAVDPKSGPCALRLGLALLAAGRAAEAERALRTSVSRQRTPEAFHALGLALRAQARLPEALEAWTQVVALEPDSAEAHDRLGALVADTEGFDAALPHFRTAVRLDPKLATAWCNLGLACAQTEQLQEALPALERALAIDPQLHKARLGCGLVYQKANRIDLAVEAYSRVVQDHPENHEAQSARLLCLNYVDTITPEALAEEHRVFGRKLETPPPPPAPPRFAVAGRRLRLAFHSPDLRAHSVAYFLEPLLNHLDRTQFELVLYHDHVVTDATSARLKAHASLWRNFASWPNATVEACVRKDAPDVLVDLAGHTGFNRLPVFARRVAPLQISYLGYPNTTGLTSMDVRLTDAWADPPGSSDSLHTERLVRFSSTAWSYLPAVSAPTPTAPPGTVTGTVVFGSFNNAAKLSNHTLALWARVLGAVPKSRLLLKGSGLDDHAFQAQLRDGFAKRDVDPNRIDFLGRTPGLESHLAVYHQVDIALDTFPYHGTTTTCEALWMGRPTLTRAGHRHASRVGVSLLQAVGHPEWIAHDDDDFVSRALHLAEQVEERRILAFSLRDQLRQSPLLDHAGQARRLGDAIRAEFA